MKESEIRIGNYFEYKKHIIEFAIEDFVEISNNDQFLELFLKPIKLTEQWLKDFGFEKTTYNAIHSLQGWESTVTYIIDELWGIIFCKKQIIFGYESDNEGYVSLCSIQYVHQLQNLYFALTKKELTSNLKVIKL